MPAFEAETEMTFVQFMRVKEYQWISSECFCLKHEDEWNSSELGALTDFAARMAESWFEMTREHSGIAPMRLALDLPALPIGDEEVS